MAKRIKIVFEKITLHERADLVGKTELMLRAFVDHSPVGDPDEVFKMREEETRELDPATWSKVVDVTGRDRVGFLLQAFDRDIGGKKQDLGTVKSDSVHGPPWRQRSIRLRAATGFFTVEVAVHLEVDGDFDHQPVGTIFVCRQGTGPLSGLSDCTTVDGRRFRLRAEIHPVRPVPTAGLPPRPALPIGTRPVRNGDATTVTFTSPPNVIPNPSVIPILDSADQTEEKAARIEITFFQPSTLKFTKNDSRITWRSRPSGSAGGAVDFLSPAQGSEVHVFGTTAGEVLVEAVFRGSVIARHRALVSKIGKVLFRANILRTANAGRSPLSLPSHVEDHIGFANKFLRQAGIELSPDPDTTTTNGAAATAHPGIFEIDVAQNRTFNVTDARLRISLRLNRRTNVVNFAYIHSSTTATDLGAAMFHPASGLGPSVTDSGPLSSSWKTPSGVDPDGAAAPITMTTLAASPGPAAAPDLTAMFLTNANGDPFADPAQPTEGISSYANTMAHEFGHLLNLGHRGVAGDPFDDGVLYPPEENLMHPTNSFLEAQDLDILQAKIMHASPLVNH